MAKQTIANTPEADSASVYIGADASNKWVKVRGVKLATKAQLDEVEQVADDAKTIATTAKGTAETADSKATAAQTAAGNAASAATAAQTAATNAQNAANDAGTAAATATQKATEAVVAANSVTGDIDKIWGRMREIYTPEMTEQHDYPVSALWFYNGLTVPSSSLFPTNTAGTYDSVYIPTGNSASEVKLRVKGLSYAEDAVFSVLAMCQKLTLYVENTELGYITRGTGAKAFGWLCFSVRIVQVGILAITEMANCTFTLTYTGTNYSVLVPPAIPSVGNGTVTITQGGSPKGSFSMNQSANKTIEIEPGGTQNRLVLNFETDDLSAIVDANGRINLDAFMDNPCDIFSSDIKNIIFYFGADAPIVSKSVDFILTIKDISLVNVIIYAPSNYINLGLNAYNASFGSLSVRIIYARFSDGNGYIIFEPVSGKLNSTITTGLVYTITNENISLMALDGGDNIDRQVTISGPEMEEA